MNPSADTATPDIVKIDYLSFKYPDGRDALRDISLAVTSGKVVGLIGPNGAGKSTLLLHLNGVLRGSGSVHAFGMPVTGKNLKTIRNKVGLVFQDPNDQLFSPTVFDDIAFGPINMGLTQAEVGQRVSKALVWVGLLTMSHDPRIVSAWVRRSVSLLPPSSPWTQNSWLSMNPLATSIPEANGLLRSYCEVCR